MHELWYGEGVDTELDPVYIMNSLPDSCMTTDNNYDRVWYEMATSPLMTPLHVLTLLFALIQASISGAVPDCGSEGCFI